MASLHQLQDKLHERKRKRDRQRKLYAETGQEGHKKAFLRHMAAVRYLRDRIAHKRETTPLRLKAFDVAEGLVRRKWSDAEIRAALGANWTRVLGQIWPA